jgi:hypothetical protein
MHGAKPHDRQNSPKISSELIAYIAKRNAVSANREQPKIEDKAQQTKRDPVNSSRNIRLVNEPVNKKIFEYQIMFGEMESILLGMNLNNPNVQAALVKLNEIRTRILPELEKTPQPNTSARR